MRDVVIASSVRTAGGSFGGQFKGTSMVDLGAAAVREAVRRAGVEPESVGQVIFGNGWQAGNGPNPARICTLKGGLPQSCPAFTINLRCGSSLRAIQLAALSVAAGDDEVVLAGGAESSSSVPHLARGLRWGVKRGDFQLIDTMDVDGYFDPMCRQLMGSTAENLAKKYGIPREESDLFALESHRKAAAALDAGHFTEETVPVMVKEKGGSEVEAVEQIPRHDASLEKMGKLPPVFEKDGTVTAGNSCAICDGAAATVLMSGEKAVELGVRPLARILSYSYVALDPAYMGLGPALAIPKALDKAGLKLGDIDLFEINEAFAVQVLACNRELGIDPSKINVHGGAIALGHPVAATGAKILATLLHALRAYGKRLGCVSLCVGGGQGVALIVERIE